MRFALLFVLIGLTLPLGVTQAMQQTPPVDFQLGRGQVISVEWKPDGTQILVNTVAGAWIYTPDLALVTLLEGVQNASFSADGRFLAGVHEKAITLFDGDTFQKLDGPLGDGHLLWNTLLLMWHPSDPILIVSANGVPSIDTTDSYLFGVQIINVVTRDYHKLNSRPLEAIAWSPEGDYLAGLNHTEKIVAVWRMSDFSRIELEPIDIFMGYGAKMAWQDANILSLDILDERTFSVSWDARTGAMVNEIAMRSAVGEAQSHDKAYIAWGGSFRDPIVVDTVSGGWRTPINVRDYLGIPESVSIRAITWSDDNQVLAFGTSAYFQDEEVRIIIINHVTEAVLHDYGGHRWRITQLLYSPDSRYLLSVDGLSQLQIYDTQAGQVVAKSTEHTLINGVMGYSVNGLLATADSLGNVHIWTQQGELQAVLRLGNSPLIALFWHPQNDDYLLAKNDRGDIQVVDLTTGTVIREHQGRLGSYIPRSDLLLSWHPSGEYYAFAARENVIMIYTLEENNPPYHIYPFATATTYSFQWDAQGDFIKIIMESYTPQLCQVSLIITYEWQSNTQSIPPSGNSCLAHSFSPIRYSAIIFHSANSPQNRYATVIDEDGVGIIQEVASGNITAMMNHVITVFWRPDEDQLAILRDDHSLWIMTALGEVRYRLPAMAVVPVLPNVQPVYPLVVWSPSGQLARVASGVVMVYHAP